MTLFSPTAQYISISSFYALSLLQYCMKPHAHDRYEIMYVTKGKCSVFVMDKELILQTNQFIFLNKNITHHLLVRKNIPCSILNLEFQCKKEKTFIGLQRLIDESGSFSIFFHMPYSEYLTGEDHDELGYALKDLLLHLESSPEHTDIQKHSTLHLQDNRFLTRLAFQRTMLELSRCILKKNTYRSGTQYVQKACLYIEEHLTEELCIDDISAHVGISRSYLCSLFMQYQNCSINSYINTKRLEKACFLLKTSTLPITDIAYFCGYNSRQHFRSTFNKFMGMNPKEYRSLKEHAFNVSTGMYKRTVEKTGFRSNLLNGDYIIQGDD